MSDNLRRCTVRPLIMEVVFFGPENQNQNYHNIQKTN